MKDSVEKIAFGGGCFWCTEVIFLNLKGVKSVTPGYAGGETANPTYKQVSRGNTGHAEVILIEYDKAIITPEKLLKVFFDSHDPTTFNRQGNDVGTQYRSILLYSTDEQLLTANNYIKKLAESKKYTNKIVTELAPLVSFYPAEEYHIGYYNNHPNEPYSKFIIEPKIKKIKDRYPELLK